MAARTTADWVYFGGPFAPPDQEALEELARSMKQEGVLQPVIVREAGEGRYELVAGERRWRAAQIAGLLKVLEIRGMGHRKVTNVEAASPQFSRRLEHAPAAQSTP